jgi:hypothetical protein
MNFTIGADPELFLRNAAGEFVSSIGLIGGTKEAPKPIGEGCAVQEDNVAVEFNIPPCDSIESFVAKLDYNMDYLKSEAEKLGLVLAIEPSGMFPWEQLETPESRVFGCDPDFNAWTRQQNPRPTNVAANLRSAGGHIHVGFDWKKYNFEQVVRAMDVFVGCEMLEFDEDTERRKLYGKAGAFRRKPYGIEYRTASNAWIKSRELMEWAYRQTEKALTFVEKGKATLPDVNGLAGDNISYKIVHTINNSDKRYLPEIRAFAEQGLA